MVGGWLKTAKVDQWRERVTAMERMFDRLVMADLRRSGWQSNCGWPSLGSAVLGANFAPGKARYAFTATDPRNAWRSLRCSGQPAHPLSRLPKVLV